MKKNVIISIVALLVLVLGTSMVIAGTGSEPGSEIDPLVSKSYVDSRTAFTPISLVAGQRLIGGEGCELILRSGQATALGTEVNGVSNLTLGMDLMTGAEVGTNHLLLVPRNDGRGIVAITDIWVMVKGDYVVQ